MKRLFIGALALVAALLAPFAPAATQINLSTQVQGILPVANGGTGQTTNPSTGQLASIDYLINAGSITFTANPQAVAIRSAVLMSGTPNTLTIASAVSVTVPSGATLGTTNGVISRIYYAVANVSGVPELAVNNATGATVLDEDELISTTAVGGASNTSGVWYSTTARSNVPYKVMGFLESTQTTAGTWAQTPSTVQPCGGAACFNTVDYGKTLSDVTASRAYGTPYKNNTGKNMQVSVTFGNVGGVAFPTGFGAITVNGVYVGKVGWNAGGGQALSITTIVPPNSTYSADLVGGFTSTLGYWSELSAP